MDDLVLERIWICQDWGGGEEGQTLKSKQITIQILQNVKTNIYALTHGYYIRTTHIIASIHT